MAFVSYFLSYQGTAHRLNMRVRKGREVGGKPGWVLMSLVKFWGRWNVPLFNMSLKTSGVPIGFLPWQNAPGMLEASWLTRSWALPGPKVKADLHRKPGTSSSFKSFPGDSRDFPSLHSGKESACQCRGCRKTQVQSLGWEDSMEKEMAAHSSILAWKIRWTE